MSLVHKVKEVWKKIPKWLKFTIGAIIFVIAVYLVPLFSDSKEETVDEHKHKESLEFNKDAQIKQCRRKYCYGISQDKCRKRKEYNDCVRDRVERARKVLK